MPEKYNACPMFERFTDRARKVMQLATQEAQRLKHDHVGTEHLLLGLVKEGTGVGAGILQEIGIDPDALQKEIERRSHGPNTANPPTNPRQTSRLLRVFDYANEESAELGHSRIGTEHLLLGIMREPESCAARSLAALQCVPEMVRARFAGADCKPMTATGKLLERAIQDLAANIPAPVPTPEVLKAVAEALIKAGWRPQS